MGPAPLSTFTIRLRFSVPSTETGAMRLAISRGFAQWNLARLAETLLGLIDPDDDDRAVRLATDAVNGFAGSYKSAWLAGMRRKIGLTDDAPGDEALITDLLTAMKDQGVDYTKLFRQLTEAADGPSSGFVTLIGNEDIASDWLGRWQDRCGRDPQTPQARREAMARVNPVYIPRNHKVEEALNSARAGDLALFHRLLEALSEPFVARAGFEDYAQPAPGDFGPYRTFCGT